MIFVLASCAAPNQQAKTQKTGHGVSSQQESQAGGRADFYKLGVDSSGKMLWWNISEGRALDWQKVVNLRKTLGGFDADMAMLAKNLSEMKARKFLFDKSEQHGYDSFESRLPQGVKQFSPKPVLSNDSGVFWAWFSVFLIFLITASLLWRGLSLVWMFFSLWKRERNEELFNKAIVAKSTFVPPVSLFLNSNEDGPGLLSQISAVERLDYEETELIVFREAKRKEEDAVLLKDFRLRYRSPLYFADLDSEDPFEILEVQGDRRILLVYYRRKDLRMILSLFLKLARYPLIGFLRDDVRLHSEALALLVYRWLREKEQKSCVYGFIDESSRNPFLGPVNLLQHENLLLNGLKANHLESWIGQKSFFCIASKSLAIQSVEMDWGGPFHALHRDRVCSFEIAGSKLKSSGPGEDIFMTLLASFASSAKNLAEVFQNGMSRQSLRSAFNNLSWMTAGFVWPLILGNYAAAVISRVMPFENFGSAVLFLGCGEIVLMMLSSLIWGVFSHHKINRLFPPRITTQIREKISMAV